MSNVMQYDADTDTDTDADADADVQDPQVVVVLKPPNILRH